MNVQLGFCLVQYETWALLHALLLPLYEQDLHDVAHTLERWLVATPGVMQTVTTGTIPPTWRLSAYGELTVRELVAILRQPGLPPEALRQRIGEAMCVAGYARPTA